MPLYNKIKLYTEDELKILLNKCLEIHYHYPLGVCLEIILHKEFHRIYGNSEFTPEQFKEFYYNKTGKNFDFIYKILKVNK